jgi:prepilin-type processing-associated H-X9-DG protein
LVRLLPYLDQSALYASVNFEVQMYPITLFRDIPYPANQTAHSTVLAVYLCPTDGALTPTPYGSNYRGNYGIGPYPATNSSVYDSGNGFYSMTPVVLSPASFPDGLAHTVAYSERLRGTGKSEVIAPARDFGDIQQLPSCVDRDADFALMCCRLASRTFPAWRTAGFTWFLGDFDCTAYNHAQEPNGAIPDATTFEGAFGIVTARSLHLGGVNAVMGDGSVRFVTSTISRKVWRGLGTRNGDELVE